jgi:hypothetical protein
LDKLTIYLNLFSVIVNTSVGTMNIINGNLGFAFVSILGVLISGGILVMVVQNELAK